MPVASGNAGKQSCGSGELGITAVLKVPAVPVWAKGPLLQFQSSRKAMAQEDMKVLKNTVPGWSHR